MHNQNNAHTFIDSLLQSQHQFMQAIVDHRDQLSDAMSSIAQSYLDTSIERVKRFHEHVSSDASGLKSDVLAATLKAAIDQHHHLKDRLNVHKHHTNTHKQTIRRLAMGMMATFGVMSAAKAADVANLDGSSGDNSLSLTVETISKLDSLKGQREILEAGWKLHSQANDYFSSAEKSAKSGDVQGAVENYMKYAKLYYPQPNENQELANKRQRTISQSDLLSVANKVAAFDAAYYSEAVELYMMVSDHAVPIVGRYDFKDAALKIASFGEQFYPEAVKLYMQFVNYSNSPDAIDFMNRTSKIFEEFYSSSETIENFESKYQDATASDLLEVSQKILSFGDAYAQQAAEILVKLVNRKDVSEDVLYYAVEILVKLADRQDVSEDVLYSYAMMLSAEGKEQLHPVAAKLYVSLALHKDANIDSILSSAYRLTLLGNEYYPQATKLYLMLADNQDISPNYKLSIADGLAKIGSTKLATKLYKEVISHKDASAYDIQSALAEIAKITPSKGKAKAKR